VIPHPQTVRELAYRLWEKRGRGDWLADEDWYAAEQQLAAGDVPSLEEPTAIASSDGLRDAIGESQRSDDLADVQRRATPATVDASENSADRESLESFGSMRRSRDARRSAGSVFPGSCAGFGVFSENAPVRESLLSALPSHLVTDFP
jgi:hypothetical protein